MSLQNDVTAYLNQENVPDFLMPVTSMPMYSRVDVNCKNAANPYDEKYKRYFSKLATNPIDTYSDDGTFPYGCNGARYMEDNQVWRPAIRMHDEIPHSSTNQKSFQSLFSNFSNVPTMFTNFPLSGLSLQTCVDMPDGVHIYGGLRPLENGEYYNKIKTISKDFTIPPENITLKFDYDLPFPLERNKFESIACEPFPYHVKYDPGCNSLTTLLNLCASEDSEESNSSSSSSFQSSGLSGLLFPKSLCCSSAAKLSDRFYALYGGIEVIEEIKYPDDNHCVIEKTLIVSEQFWIFDCLSLKYKEIKLNIHPAYAPIFSKSIPRFGHCSVAVPIEESNNNEASNDKDSNSKGTPLTSNSSTNVETTKVNSHNQDIVDELKKNHHWNSRRRYSAYKVMQQFEKPAILFFMGGYTNNSEGNSFVAVNDIWKCQVFLDEFGVSDEIVCSPLGMFDMVDNNYSFVINSMGKRLPNHLHEARDDFSGVCQHYESNGTNWPSPRGFFSMILVDKNEIGKYFVERGTDEILASPDVQSPRPKKNVEFASPFYESTKTHSGSTSSSSSPIFLRNTSYKNKASTTSPLASPIREIDRGSSPASFDVPSSVTDRVTLTSVHSDFGIHMSQIRALNSKILLVQGGSSITYTKVMDENSNESKAFYNKSILGDFWCFDFQTERWYRYETTYQEKPMNLAICGHLLVAGEEHINIFGGLQKLHYEDKDYEPMCISKDNCDVNLLKIVKEFHNNISKEKGIDGLDMLLLANSQLKNQKFNHPIARLSSNRQNTTLYTSYVLDVKSHMWAPVDYALVRDLHVSKLWRKGQPAYNGGVFIYNGQYWENLQDSPCYLVYTVSFSTIYDSKLICIVNDVHIMDSTNDKHANTRQCIWASGVIEIYTSFLTF